MERRREQALRHARLAGRQPTRAHSASRWLRARHRPAAGRRGAAALDAAPAGIAHIRTPARRARAARDARPHRRGLGGRAPGRASGSASSTGDDRRAHGSPRSPRSPATTRPQHATCASLRQARGAAASAAASTYAPRLGRSSARSAATTRPSRSPSAAASSATSRTSLTQRSGGRRRRSSTPPRRARRGGTARPRGGRDHRAHRLRSTTRATRSATSPRCSPPPAARDEAADALEQALGATSARRTWPWSRRSSPSSEELPARLPSGRRGGVDSTPRELKPKGLPRLSVSQVLEALSLSIPRPSEAPDPLPVSLGPDCSNVAI